MKTLIFSRQLSVRCRFQVHFFPTQFLFGPQYYRSIAHDPDDRLYDFHLWSLFIGPGSVSLMYEPQRGEQLARDLSICASQRR